MYFGHVCCTCETGKSETPPEMLRSILAQLEYTSLIRKWDSEGVPFRQHMYVPEVHPQTLEGFQERDEPLVLKVHTLIHTPIHYTFMSLHLICYGNRN